MQSTLEPIARENIADAVATRLRHMILDGALPEGERINEVHLSRRLGVSRTPLREALIRLGREGALTAIPRIGYFVQPLTLEELEQLYAIRPLLDPKALALTGIPSPKRLAYLDALNRKLSQADDPETALALDNDWHRELLAECPNTVLLELIEILIYRTRRYETALLREKNEVARATADHSRILRALKKGDLGAACAALEANMRSGRAAIVHWLETRKRKE